MQTAEQLRAIEILLVEDSPSDRLLALDALSNSKLINSVNVVEDGLEALAYLRRQGKYSHVRRPDLILLDLNLPRKDGREVLAEIKTDPLLQLIPVVVLTTSTAEEDVLKAYGLHANAFINKPVEFSRFTEVLQRLDGFWFEVITLPPQGRVESLARSSLPRVDAFPDPLEELVSVLLVEDSATDTFIIKHALAASSAVRFEVTHVMSMSDAEEQLKKSSFDLVITDFGLPDSQGLETLRRIRRLGVGVPIVVLTSLDDDALGIQALREGAHDYLVKGQLTPRAVARAARYAIDKKEHQEKLRQSQKLEAVGRLAAGIAHDFNNVLTIVRGNAELISEGDDPAEIKEAAKEIREASDRAIALARQLLTFSRQQAMHQKPLDLNTVVGDFTRMLRRLLGDSIKLELRLSSELPRIKADNGMLEQVLLNLGVNARDAMPFGGKLCVQTHAVELSQEAAEAYPHGEPGTFVKLTVSDTGSGMAPDVLSRIFEPFFTTKAKNQGTGLGLATVHGIVHQHHGFIAVSSRPEVGTTFEIFLPAMEPVAISPAPPSVRPLRRGGGETILLVEDEDVLRRLTERVLSVQGYRVFSAASAAEARALFGEHQTEIQLLLTDMVLPDRESGKNLAESLTAQSPTLRVVFMSGYSPDFVAEGFVLEEGVNFLQKPFQLAYLLETVKQRLESDPALSSAS